MDQHYSAFISYKHAPADIAVASEIQKRLERYHVPAAIRKKTGKDKIGRIFRDKEELPITSDLSDDINKALEDADYLIVICSSSTKLSTWVPREIDCFLKNHSKKNVLTVLVDGEPIDVIPEQLLKDTVTRTAPDGTLYEEEVVYEPLSCDFRSGLKEARRAEIPRLAAALLGCTYDELVRRERQYKRRRNLAIGIPAFLALVVAVGYLTWSRQEIAKNYQRAEENYQLAQENYQLAQENYQKSEENYQLAQENYQEAQANLNQSLKNQSSYLASESDKLLEKGDRLRAILLAMEALPDSEAEEGSPEATRPVTAVAQNALVSALQAYTSRGIVDAQHAINTVAEFAMQGSIADYFGTGDGRYVVIRDNNGNVGVWDIASLSQIMMLNREEIKDVRLLSDTRIVILSDLGVAAYDLSSGSELWRYKEEEVYWGSGGICLAEDANIVWVGKPVKETHEDYSWTYGVELLELDALTGEKLSITKLLENSKDSTYIERMNSTKNGKWVAIATRSGYSMDGVPVQVFLKDREKDSLSELKLKQEYGTVDSMIFVKDSSIESEENNMRLFMMAYPLESYGKGGQNVLMNLYSEIQPMTVSVSCYDTASADLLWENSYGSPQIKKVKSGRALNYSEETRSLVSLYANKIAVMRISDGKITDEAETTSSIVTSGINVHGALVLYLDNGNVGVYHFDEPGVVRQMSYFNYDLQSATYINRIDGSGSDYLVVPKAKCVWLCREVYDDEFVPYPGEFMNRDMSLKDEAMAGDTIAVLNYDSKVFLYDLSGEGPGQQIDLPGEGYQYEILGSDQTSGIVWIYDKGTPKKLIALNASDGTMQEYLNEKQDISYPSFLPDGTFVYWVYDYPKNLLMSAKAADGTLEETILMNYKSVSYKYSVRPDLKYIAMEDSEVIRIKNLETGETAVSEDLFQESLGQVVWQETEGSKSDLLALTDGYETVILKTDGTEIARLSETGSRVVNMTSYEDELIVLYGGGLLTRYDWNGKMISRSSLAHYDSESFEKKVRWEFEDDELYLIRRGTYCLMHVIDLETWEESAAIQYGLGHDKARDRIVSYNSENKDTKRIGYFPHYTVEEMRRKAKEALHGTELTEEEKDMYGLR